MLEEDVIRVVVRYLKKYSYMNKIIEKLEDDIKFMTITERDVNSYLKSKGKISRSVEVEVMKRISIENEIKRIRKWKAVIETVLNIYKEFDPAKYEYMQLKFFTGNSVVSIKFETTLGETTQTKYRREGALYIAIFAAQEKLISMKKVDEILKMKQKNDGIK